jgi:hypothetical protein
MAVSNSTRAPTPIVHHATREDPEKHSLAIIRTCYCSRVMSGCRVDLAGRMSPTNDEIRFFYKGTQYKVFVSGKGYYYLTKNPKGDLILVRDKRQTEFPCCDLNFRNAMAMV